MERFVCHVKNAFDNHVDPIITIDFVRSIVQQHASQLTVHNEKCDLYDNEYVRELVHREDRFEIYIIRWAPGSKSKIHDHSERGCVMKLLTGTLVETRFDSESLETLDSIIHTANTQASFIHNSNAVHSVENQSTDSCAMSVHLYAPPNYVAHMYEK